MNNKLLIVLIFIVFSVVLFLFWMINNTKSSDENREIKVDTDKILNEINSLIHYADETQNKEAVEIINSENVPNYFGFESLTIPYLRNKSYDTPLFEIQNEISKNNIYNEYLASYRSDGFRINGLLTVPNDDPPENGYPAVIFLHGYIPPDEYKTTEKYVAYVDYLARNGFVVYKIDYRGHAESEGKPSGAYFSSNYVIDTINAINAISTYEKVDSENIGLWGHSMSGNILLRTMAAKPEIKAGVIFAGAVYTYKDFREYGISDSSFVRASNIPSEILKRSQSLFETVGDITDNTEFWSYVAPTTYLEEFDGAVQIHHAKNDDVVTIEYSRGLKTLLDEAQVPNELYEYDLGGHNLTSPAFTPAMERSVEFYRKQFETIKE